jgi:hypothetical protein
MTTYKLWQDYLRQFPKGSRYTLGSKIDTFFVETIELVFLASTISKDKKLPFIERAVSKFDVLKFFLQIAWEVKALDNKKYAALSEPLSEIGKMLGGWHKQLTIKVNPAKSGE